MKRRVGRSAVSLGAQVACALVGVLFGCRRVERTPPVVADPVKDDAAPSPSPRTSSLVLLHARVIDVERGVVVNELEAELPLLEALQRDDDGGGAAYLLTKSGDLHAYDARSGKRRWSVTGEACTFLVAARAGAVCAGRTGVVVHDAETGAAHALATKGGVTQVVPLGSGARLLVAHDDKTVDAFDGRTLAPLGSSTLPFVVSAFEGLVENADGACAASADDDLHLACVDARATTTWSKTYPLRRPTDPAGTRFFVRASDGRFVVASTSGSTAARRGVVVRASDGLEVASVEEEIASAVATNGGALDGVLVTHPGPGIRYLSPSGVMRWSSARTLQVAARAVLVGDALVVTSFTPSVTGAELYAFDRSTGRELWRGDVELAPIAHSRYRNDTEVSFDFGHVALRGRESGQTYLELFRPNDGARTFSELRRLW